MSDLESKQHSIKFEPVVDRAAAPPGIGSLIGGVVWPAGVIAIELATRMCADAFFDPMPTLWHALAVSLVPVSNLLLWRRLRRPLDATAQGGSTRTTTDRWLILANGAAIAIAAFYALIFLPILPMALVAVVVGMGLLPMAPLAGLVVAVGLARRLKAQLAPPRLGRVLGGGIAAGLAFLLLLDVPAAATRLGLQWATSSSASQRERGLTLLRTLGDHDLLLRLCYDSVGRPAGLLSALVMVGGSSLLAPEQRQIVQSPAEVREVYYRVTGKAFNAQPAPLRRTSWRDEFAFDADHGGTEVGGRIKGLDIVSSRMDISVAGNDAVAYVEWVFEFRNTSFIDREVRLQMALPPGGVVSRATLWVNGEEKEGAYGGRGEVRAAYQKVAVIQRRDPLLVTTKGADRVLAQAFPVGRNGGTIKFKIGITAPLELIESGKARLALPAVFDRNFSFPHGVSHSVWIESKQPLATAVMGLATTRVDAGLFRVAGLLGDTDLARTRPFITVERDPGAGPVVAKLGEGEAVLQELVTSTLPKATALMLVVDGSARMRTAAPQLAAALRALPPTARVGLIVAGEPLQRIALAPASGAHKERIAKLIREVAYVGGQDNGPALAEALLALESEANAKLLWVHGPQPVPFRRSAAQLEQATERLKHLPEIFLYAVDPGPNELLPDSPWGWSAHLLPRVASPDADLAVFLTRELGDAPRPVLRRVGAKAGETVEATRGSDHIARLWAKERIDTLLRDKGGSRADAVALAVQYRLVTPVSGVVVLESKQQYDDSRLTPVSQATVPTVPEPHEWALMLVACLGLGWLARRYRRHQARPSAMVA